MISLQTAYDTRVQTSLEEHVKTKQEHLLVLYRCNEIHRGRIVNGCYPCYFAEKVWVGDQNWQSHQNLPCSKNSRTVWIIG